MSFKDDSADWTKPEELEALEHWAIEAVSRRTPALCVEVGTWTGNSAQALAKGLGWHGYLFCVDNFCGDPNPDFRKQYFDNADPDQVEQAWRARMLQHLERTFLLRMDSLSAAAMFGDSALDLVFVDGCHAYDAVSTDLNAWGKKVRKGGLLCGHDFDQPGVRDGVLDCMKRWPDCVRPKIVEGPRTLWRVGL